MGNLYTMPVLYHELQEGRKKRQGREGPEQLKLGGNRAKSTDGELTIMVITADWLLGYLPPVLMPGLFTSTWHLLPPLITSTATQPGRYYHHISWRNWGTENICNLPKVTQLKQMVELTFEPSALNHKLNTEFSAEFKIHLLLNLQPGFTPSELKIRH